MKFSPICRAWILYTCETIRIWRRDTGAVKGADTLRAKLYEQS